MQIKFMNGKIGVEKLKGQKKNRSQDGFFADVESEEFLGIVKYVDEESGPRLDGMRSNDLNHLLGEKVFFGNQYQNVHMQGSLICVMDSSNLLAVVREDKKETETK